MLKEPKKILIIRSGAVGDVLMATPLVKAVRKRFPKARISYLVGNWSKDVLKNNPYVDNIISFDDSIIFKREIVKILALIKKLRKEKFDICFILDKSYQWNIFAYACKIKTRIGFNRNGEGFINTLNADYKGKKNELEYYLDIAKLLKIKVKDKKLKLFLTKKDNQFSNYFIKKNKLKNKEIIGIAPGAAVNPGQKLLLKRWPKEKYIGLINKLVKNYNIILFGGKEDKELCNSIISSINSRSSNNLVNACGITLQQSAALMKKCSLFITHDSGPVHIADTAGIPIIALFGPTDPKRFAPLSSVVIRKSLKCSPCYDIYGNYKKCKHHKCMESINVEEVIRAAKKLL